jgi:general secretion pathway protein G
MVQQRGRQVDTKTKRRNPSAAGFSLIEVLIVIVVIGIIMAITVSALLNARDKARQGATIADMRNIATAIEAYTVDHSVPPVTQAFTNIAVLLRPYHNQNVPVDDHWGHIYTYVRDVDGDYSLTSFGKDGVDGDDMTPETRYEFTRDIVVTNGKFPGLE